MNDASQIREHMEVIGADSGHVGTVDKVEGDRIKLTRDDRNAGGVHHWLPVGMVDGVEGDKVRMSFVAELAPQFWDSKGGKQ
jgi:hypothetical protein